MNQKVGTIYISTNLQNRKQYVGQTINGLRSRISSHKYQAKEKQYKNVFHNAIKKYGIENFKWISYSCPEEDLDWHERLLIKELDTLTPNGYNLDSGGNKNKKVSKFGKRKWDEKQKENQSKIMTKRYQENLELNKGENHPRFGKHWDDMHKQNQSKKMKGRYIGEKNPNAKSVILTSPIGKQYILPAYITFCKNNNLNIGHICEVLQGKRKHHKGWTGKYTDNDK